MNFFFLLNLVMQITIALILLLPIKQAYPVFKDPHRYSELADPLLQANFPMRSLHQAVAVAAMCLNEEPSVRPLISDVVTALTFLGTAPGSQDLTGIAPVDMSSSPQEANNSAPLNLLDDDIFMDRQRAVAEAIEWGTNTRSKAPLRDSPTSL